MKNNNSIFTRKLGKTRADKLKLALCLFFVFLFLTNIFAFINLNDSRKPIPGNGGEIYDDGSTVLGSDKPSVSAYTNNISLFEAPYNYTKSWAFFEEKYENETALDLPFSTYYRKGDKEGTILEDLIYSQDQLFLYKSLLSEQLTNQELFERYLHLENSDLWYNGSGEYEYGLMRSYNTTSKQIEDDNRYLVDNLMVVFTLLEEIGGNLDQITLNGTQPVDSVEKMFELINSSEFYNDALGFKTLNDTNYKDVKSNLWAILAFLQISEDTDITANIRDQAFNLANETLNVLIDNMWDFNNLGFFNSSTNNDWSTPVEDKYLDVNALGIISLIECWNKFENDTCLNFSKKLYDKLNDTLWNSTLNGYSYKAQRDFTNRDFTIELESNALMMQAGLKLFEATGNFSYYNRSIQLFETFESTKFYNESLGAYNSTFNPYDGNKNLHKNSRVSETYLKALEIYEKAELSATYSVDTETPNYIFKQDTLRLNAKYDIPDVFNISKANLTYIVRYPNGSILNIVENSTFENGTSYIQFPINNLIPIGQNYSISVLANRSYFETGNIVKYFNVISGIGSNRIEDLDFVESIYQGQTLNVTLPVTSSRSDSIDLIVSIVGLGYVERSKTVTINKELTNVSMLVTAKPDAGIGTAYLYFILEDAAGNIYHQKLESIDIVSALELTNFVYKSKATKGSEIKVSYDMKNFLPENNQSLNISFTGEYIQDLNSSVLLKPNQKRSLLNSIELSDDIQDNTVHFEMLVKKGVSIVFNKTFTIEILSDLEVIGMEFPTKITQGDTANLIITIQSNKQVTENFSLYVNGNKVDANINELLPGENKIVKDLIPTINPYELGTVSYEIVLRDSSGEIISSRFFEVKVELSPFNLVIFYLIPIIIPIGIVLFYKHKDLKNMMLRR